MSDGPIRLKGAQRSIRDAYFSRESGLYTLNCVPGAGKSVVAHHLPAEDMLRRYVNGDKTPEQHVAVISFTRGEASTILPEVCDRLRELVEHNLVPAATQVSEAELEHLLQRVRQAPYAGTIDSVLRTVLSDIVRDIGFDGMPVVGNTARQKQLHAICYREARDNSELVQPLARLERAYPEQQFADGIQRLLRSAVAYCRDRRVSTTTFREKLEQTVKSVYPHGPPASFGDVIAVVGQFVDAEINEELYEHLDGDDRRALVAADRRLYDSWRNRLDDFCTVLAEYRRIYRNAIRERGIVSHTDVAYLVDAYFDERIDGCDESHRVRVQNRYQTRIQSLVIDEAQDVSAIQHAALSHLVSPDTRVFGSGDLLQSIYRWRHADPLLFQSAIKDGQYLGIDWKTHEHRTATTTYRCCPAVAAAINSIAKPVLTDKRRGAFGALDVTYPGIEPERPSTNETNIHVASFSPKSADPDSFQWVAPDNGTGEADVTARLIAKGLADGTFTDENGDPLGVTVLFRWSTMMDAYKQAFTDQGLRIRDTSKHLFACPVVQTVLDVCEWLSAPESPKRTIALVTESNLGLCSLEDAVQRHDTSLDQLRQQCDLSEAQQQVLDGLISLRERRDLSYTRPASEYVEEVIELLALRADPHDNFDIQPDHRVANLDALTETVAEWEHDEQLSLSEFTELIEPFRESPRDGPSQPTTANTEYDVEFRTVHDAKGDQDNVVVVANPGFPLSKHGTQSKRFVAQGEIAGLAPPTNIDTTILGERSTTQVPGPRTAPTESLLPPYRNGIYNPEKTTQPDIGLRWATAHWSDTLVDSVTDRRLVGPEHLRNATANQRAEAWRLLYVALTRAQDHLVVPLPNDTGVCDLSPRDRWLDAIQEGLEFDGSNHDTYTVENSTTGSSQEFDVGINDVSLEAAWTPETRTQSAAVAVRPPQRVTEQSWVPRFVRPSTMYRLTEQPENYMLAHLLGKSRHTGTNAVPDNHPLPFDRMGPDDVGTCLHDVLTTLVERDVTETAIRARAPVVRAVFEQTLQENTPHVRQEEQDALFVFFEQQILESFLDSDLWTRITDAETVKVEQAVDGIVTIADIEFEIHGEADFVIEMPAGERHVADVKIALAPVTADSRRQYELQVAAYAYLFERHQSVNSHITRTIETFGADRETIRTTWPPRTVERRLARLLER
ncbi:UvrD-helicase domain-containing protein [Halovenus rubra]|uniref:UvrD-helicase domain-containing protein n=2 Tax=Halovenus rubra TaxID=869890 RepID=A0ACC7E515_9EURY|nr:UvrD-helicase domain-containing protein [Halovenus rubra]